LHSSFPSAVYRRSLENIEAPGFPYIRAGQPLPGAICHQTML
jgi:hypothetical protein